MFDPTSPLTVPPPRYLLESDSSDEEGQGAYPSTSHRPARPRHQVVVRLLTPPSDPLADPSDSPLPSLSGAGIVGVGQAGKYLLRRAPGRPVLEVTVDGKRQGTGLAIDGGVVVAVQDGAAEAAFEIVKQLAVLIKASSWTLFSSYVPPMYIPLPHEVVPTDPPVRVLSTAEVKGMSGYEAPNYVTGLAGAFLSQAAHPASPILVPAKLFLLPLPLSQLAPSMLASALDTLPQNVGRQLARPAPWNEDDDERFAGPGMGARPRDTVLSEGTGMYM